MAEYKDELDEPESVTWLDDEEMLISDVWTLSIGSDSIGNIVCNYDVVKDYSKKYKLEHIEVFRVCKYMMNEFNSKKK